MSRRSPFALIPSLLGLAALLALALAALLLGPDTAQSQTAPTVTGVEVTSDAGDDDTYALGEIITITVTFSQNVTVTGTPQLKIDMDPADWGTKVVDYASGSGSASLTFDHTVVEPNYSTQGIAVLENSLALNGGTIKSSASQTNASLSHTGKDHDPEHKVDWNLAPAPDPQSTPTPEPTATPIPHDPPGTPLKVRSIKILTQGDLGPGPDKTYGLCDVVFFEVGLNRPLADNQTESKMALRFLLGEQTVTATYYAGGLSGTDWIGFFWHVGGSTRHDNADNACPTSSDRFVSYDGIAFPENALSVDAGAVPSPALEANSSLLVDSTLPRNTSAYDLNCAVTIPSIEQVDIRELEVTWSVKSGYAFCDAGGWFVDIRTDGEWGSHRVSKVTSNRAYRHGAQYGVHYEFRIRAVDARGRKVAEPDAAWITTSAFAGRTLSGAPEAPHLVLRGPGSILVRWDHAVADHVDSHNGYEIRYRKKSDADWTVSNRTPYANVGTFDFELRIEELEGVEYVVRACSKVTIDGQPEALCAKDMYFTPATDPHRTWLIDDTPNINHNIGRVFMMVESNYPEASSTCDINGGIINCPPRTLVSLNIHAGGSYEVTATTYFGTSSENLDCSEPGRLCTINLPIEFLTDGGGAIRHFGASGGDGQIVMSWSSVRAQYLGRTFQLNGKSYKNKELDSILVEYRTSLGPAGWTSVRVDPELTHFVLTGARYGTYQVRVRPCMATVEVVNGAETGDLHRCLAVKNKHTLTREIDGVTVSEEFSWYTDDPGVVRGQTSPIVTVVVAPDHTARPKAPTSVTITRSGSTLKASWHIVPHEGGSEIYDYRLRYRRVGESNWQYVQLHAPYDIPCTWKVNFECGRTGNREILNVFQGSGPWEVAIQSRNANGESEWLSLGQV